MIRRNMLKGIIGSIGILTLNFGFSVSKKEYIFNNVHDFFENITYEKEVNENGVVLRNVYRITDIGNMKKFTKIHMKELRKTDSFVLIDDTRSFDMKVYIADSDAEFCIDDNVYAVTATVNENGGLK